MRLLLLILTALSLTWSSTSSAHAKIGEPCARAEARVSGARAGADGTQGRRLYAQARYLDANTGRFLSLDPVAGVSSDPLTTHGWSYANANPTKFVDPDGRFVGFLIGATVGFAATGAEYLLNDDVKDAGQAARRLTEDVARLSNYLGSATHEAAGRVDDENSRAAIATFPAMMTEFLGGAVSFLPNAVFNTEETANYVGTIPERALTGAAEMGAATTEEELLVGFGKTSGAVGETLMLVLGAGRTARGGAAGLRKLGVPDANLKLNPVALASPLVGIGGGGGKPPVSLEPIKQAPATAKVDLQAIADAAREPIKGTIADEMRTITINEHQSGRITATGSRKPNKAQRAELAARGVTEVPPHGKGLCLPGQCGHHGEGRGIAHGENIGDPVVRQASSSGAGHGGKACTFCEKNQEAFGVDNVTGKQSKP